MNKITTGLYGANHENKIVKVIRVSDKNVYFESLQKRFQCPILYFQRNFHELPEKKVNNK